MGTVAVSNDIVLYSELEGKYGPRRSEGKFPTVYVVVGIVVFVVISASVFTIWARRKKA